MNHDIIPRFRTRLESGCAVGTFCKTSDPAVVESLGRGGFDFVVLDMEHGPNGLETIGNLIRAAEITDMLPIVRVRGCNDDLIGMALDIGAAGVQVPQIRSAGDIRSATKRARFAPLGERGVCRYVRAAGYSSIDRDAYFDKTNHALVIAQIEANQAIRHLDDILDVGGFDVLFVGPYDLSQSMGLTGQVDHPEVVNTIKDIVTRCRARGVVTGTFVDDSHSARHWISHGVQYACVSVDVGIIVEASQRLNREIRQ